MCCHDIRQATETNNKTKQNTQTKRLSLLGPAGQQGPQCYNLHTYIYVSIYFSLYIWVGCHGARPRRLNLTKIMHNTMGTNSRTHTRRLVPCLQRGCPGLREAGLRANRPARPAALHPSVPTLFPGPNLPGVSPTPLLAGSAFSLHPPVPLWRVSLALFPPTEISR